MKTTQEKHPGSMATPFNLNTHVMDLVQSLLAHLAVYDLECRGELVLIEFNDEDMNWIQDTYGVANPLQLLSDMINRRYAANIVEYVEGYQKLHPSLPPKLEVVQRVTSTDGNLVVTSHPMLQILTPFSYHPKQHDGQFVDGDYVVPLDYLLE